MSGRMLFMHERFGEWAPRRAATSPNNYTWGSVASVEVQIQFGRTRREPDSRCPAEQGTYRMRRLGCVAAADPLKPRLETILHSRARTQPGGLGFYQVRSHRFLGSYAASLSIGRLLLCSAGTENRQRFHRRPPFLRRG